MTVSDVSQKPKYGRQEPPRLIGDGDREDLPQA